MQTDKTLVSIIIVNWNGEEVLPECLDSLLALNYKNIEIIVVDNGSIDNSINIVRKTYGNKVKIVPLEKNIGFAAGMNAGFENAAGEIIATLNNDMIVENDWLDQPLEFLREDKSIGMVSCRQMNYYERDKVDGLYHYIAKDLSLTPFGHGCKFNLSALFSKAGYVISANGGSAIFRNNIIKELGGYDADFFGYMEETDFCLRAFLHGWKCVYAPNAIVYHKDGFSFKKVREFQYYLTNRNYIWFLYKNFPTADIIKNSPIIIYRALLGFGYSCFKLKNPLVYIKARFDAIRNLKRYKTIRKENISLFKNKRKEFYIFEKYKKLDIL